MSFSFKAVRARNASNETEADGILGNFLGQAIVRGIDVDDIVNIDDAKVVSAGVAGAIKVLLSLEHRTIPPTIHFEQANAHIDMADSPFYVNTELRPWAAGSDGTRRAAVSSFGVSGVPSS